MRAYMLNWGAALIFAFAMIAVVGSFHSVQSATPAVTLAQASSGQQSALSIFTNTVSTTTTAPQITFTTYAATTPNSISTNVQGSGQLVICAGAAGGNSITTTSWTVASQDYDSVSSVGIAKDGQGCSFAGGPELAVAIASLRNANQFKVQLFQNNTAVCINSQPTALMPLAAAKKAATSPNFNSTPCLTYAPLSVMPSQPADPSALSNSNNSTTPAQPILGTGSTTLPNYGVTNLQLLVNVSTANSEAIIVASAGGGAIINQSVFAPPPAAKLAFTTPPPANAITVTIAPSVPLSAQPPPRLGIALPAQRAELIPNQPAIGSPYNCTAQLLNVTTLDSAGAVYAATCASLPVGNYVLSVNYNAGAAGITAATYLLTPTNNQQTLTEQQFSQLVSTNYNITANVLSATTSQPGQFGQQSTTICAAGTGATPIQLASWTTQVNDSLNVSSIGTIVPGQANPFAKRIAATPAQQNQNGVCTVQTQIPSYAIGQINMQNTNNYNLVVYTNWTTTASLAMKLEGASGAPSPQISLASVALPGLPIRTPPPLNTTFIAGQGSFAVIVLASGENASAVAYQSPFGVAPPPVPAAATPAAPAKKAPAAQLLSAFGASVPSGCTLQQSVVGLKGLSAVAIITCQNMAAGTYVVSAPYQPNVGGMSEAVYVYTPSVGPTPQSQGNSEVTANVIYTQVNGAQVAFCAGASGEGPINYYTWLTTVNDSNMYSSLGILPTSGLFGPSFGQFVQQYNQGTCAVGGFPNLAVAELGLSQMQQKEYNLTIAVNASPYMGYGMKTPQPNCTTVYSSLIRVEGSPEAVMPSAPSAPVADAEPASNSSALALNSTAAKKPASSPLAGLSCLSMIAVPFNVSIDSVVVLSFASGGNLQGTGSSLAGKKAPASMNATAQVACPQKVSASANLFMPRFLQNPQQYQNAGLNDTALLLAGCPGVPVLPAGCQLEALAVGLDNQSTSATAICTGLVPGEYAAYEPLLGPGTSAAAYVLTPNNVKPPAQPEPQLPSSTGGSGGCPPGERCILKAG